VFHGTAANTQLMDGDTLTVVQVKACIGTDVGKTHHWACVVDAAAGQTALSVKLANDETDIIAFLHQAGTLAEQLIWAFDIIGAVTPAQRPAGSGRSTLCATHQVEWWQQ